MKTLRLMLALAAVAMVAVACDNDDGGGAAATDTVSTTDTVIGDAADDATTTDTVTGDTAADVAEDATTTAFLGCTADTDKAFLTSLGGDKAKADQFQADVRTCTLNKGCLAKANQAAKIQCIADCLDAVYAKDGLTSDCSSCYGFTGECGAAKCIAVCAVPGNAECDPCLAKNCTPGQEDCKAAKCDPYTGACNAK